MFCHSIWLWINWFIKPMWMRWSIPVFKISFTFMLCISITYFQMALGVWGYVLALPVLIIYLSYLIWRAELRHMYAHSSWNGKMIENIYIYIYIGIYLCYIFYTCTCHVPLGCKIYIGSDLCLYKIYARCTKL